MLIATTVIEVGVDVPNSTLMVIENAERFGMAQLHQLRGRVGRGNKASACVLIASKDPETLDESSIARLKGVASTNDGFALAEKDLALRGIGDLFGTRQSGLPPFRVADLAKDTELLLLARSDAAAWIARSPTLARFEESLLKRRLLKQYGATFGSAMLAERVCPVLSTPDSNPPRRDSPRPSPRVVHWSAGGEPWSGHERDCDIALARAHPRGRRSTDHPRVAELTRHHPETVRRYLSGQSPSVEFVAALCVALRVNAQWMLTGRGPMLSDDIRTERSAAPTRANCWARSPRRWNPSSRGSSASRCTCRRWRRGCALRSPSRDLPVLRLLARGPPGLRRRPRGVVVFRCWRSC